MLFEYEASPYCRRVRETLCVLGLRALVLPCPRETLRLEGAYGPSSKHKGDILALGGKLLFPFLVDRTAGVALNESRAICMHLWQHYGDGVDRPWIDELLNNGRLPHALDFALLAAPSGVRPTSGLMAAQATAHLAALREQPLVLHGCEPDAGCRSVRELLCELQLPWVHVPTSTASPIPHLEDPTTGFATFGACRAIEYIEERYRLSARASITAAVPDPNLGDGDRTSWLTQLLSLVPGSQPFVEASSPRN